MRAFLTIVPDVETALAISRWCDLCWPSSGRKIPVQNYHMTLAFLGETDDIALRKLSELFEDFSHGGVAVSLSKVGYWSHTDILYVGMEETPESLRSLHQKCRHAANHIGARGTAGRYEPHITLARKLATPPSAPLIDPEFSFVADSLQLWSSVRESRGARYTTVASWKLG